MEPSSLDATAKAFAQTSTRSQALRVLAGGMAGVAAILARPGRALAGGSDDHDDKDRAKSKKCNRNADCATGQVCLDGACFTGTCTTTCGAVNAPCATNAACCSGLICVNGACFSGTCTSTGGGQCTTAATCPQAAPGSCHTAVCINGTCGFSNNAAGSPCTGGTCDGAGTCVTSQCTTAATCPQAPPGSCHTAACVAGTCVFTNNAAGSPCTGGTCDAVGTCVTSQCTSASQCPPAAAGSCRTATCTGGVCGFAIDNTNLPTCAPCTSAVCVNGVPACQPSAAGTTCNSSGGTVCNGAGQCVQCVTPSNCPGTDTICASRTCVAGTCGFMFASSGTVCGTGMSCDGLGNCR